MTKGNLNNLDKSFVQNLSNNWALVTSGASDNYNMMTVNWGGIGFLWNKPVLFIFIRPERYTFEFIEKYDYFSLSFLKECSIVGLFKYMVCTETLSSEKFR